jgi:hypothetical protein
VRCPSQSSHDLTDWGPNLSDVRATQEVSNVAFNALCIATRVRVGRLRDQVLILCGARDIFCIHVYRLWNSHSLSEMDTEGWSVGF